MARRLPASMRTRQNLSELIEGRQKAAEGMLPFSAPQIADGKEPVRPEIRQHLKGRPEALEDLAVELLARGLLVRDIEGAF